jgi:hypothetical protein
VTTWIDIMGTDPVQVSRWDRGDGATAIGALDAALEAAGLPGRLEPPKRFLARAEDLAAQAREAKAAARERLEEANRLLLADGPVDVDGYGAVLVEIAPWLDEQAAGMIGVMQAVHQIRGNATATAFAMATGLHAELQGVCRVVVAEAAAVAPLPQEVWSATSTGQASTLAIRAGREADWAALTRAGDRWDSVHNAAQLLRETGQFQGQLMFSCPTAIGVAFLNWSDAVDGLHEVRRLPGPLRLRAAIDRGWRPGLYTAADHDAAAAEAKPRRNVFAALVGKSSAPVELPSAEFS